MTAVNLTSAVESVQPNDIAAPTVRNRTRRATVREKLLSSLDMIKQAIASLRVPRSRKGVSAPAIKAFIVCNIRPEVNTKHINRALKKAITTGDLIHTKGLTGAVGSFKLPPTKPSLQKKKKESPQKTKSSNKNKPRKVPATNKILKKKVIPATF